MPDLTPERREVLIAEAWASLREGRTHHGLVITVGVLGGVEMAVDQLYAEGLIK